MTDRDDTQAKIRDLIDPFNKKGVEITGGTRFAQDLEWWAEAAKAQRKRSTAPF